MKNKTSLFLIMMLGLAGFMVLANAPVTQAQDKTIVIGVVTNSNAFNRTEINLDPNTEYTIIFENTDLTAAHNLRIDVNDNIEDNENVDDSGDITIGVANNADGGTGPASWSGTFTTGDDGEIIFYCGFSGHYGQGMFGTFIVGGGDGSFFDIIPGFGLIAGISALLLIGLAVPQLRKRN